LPVRQACLPTKAGPGYGLGIINPGLKPRAIISRVPTGLVSSKFKKRIKKNIHEFYRFWNHDNLSCGGTMKTMSTMITHNYSPYLLI
jgi:hypothetical protein